MVKIPTIHHKCHNYLQFFPIVQSQLLFVTIGNNCHNFLELPQLVIICMIWALNYWTVFSQLVKIVTIVHDFQNCHTHHNWNVAIVIYQNWSKFQLFITNVTIICNSSQLYSHNYCLSQLVTISIPQLVIILIQSLLDFVTVWFCDLLDFVTVLLIPSPKCLNLYCHLIAFCDWSNWILWLFFMGHWLKISIISLISRCL